MAKIDIKMQGATKELINALAEIMLQHDWYSEVIQAAAAKVAKIEKLELEAKADVFAAQMQDMIQEGGN